MGRLSRLTHDILLGGPSESLCSHAWGHREVSMFWSIWVRVFGRDHCRNSYLHHHLFSLLD